MPTPNIGLTQPASGTTPWDGIVNNNMTIIDNCLGGSQVIPAIAPTNIKPNNVPTILAGVPALVAKADLAAQAANIGATQLYAVPANGAGTYRATVYLVITQAATVSSTLPIGTINYTENDANTIQGIFVTGTNSTNTVGSGSPNVGGITSSGTLTFQVKASTNITFSTNSYASNGATPMQYAIHVKLEYLGL